MRRKLEAGLTVRNTSFAITVKKALAPRILVSFLMVATVMVMMTRSCHAEKLQLLSVQENPPGTVNAAIAIFAGGVPEASNFQLWFDEKTAIKAKEAKALPAAEIETLAILAIDQSGSMGAGNLKEIREALTRVLSKPPAQLSAALWAFDTEVKKLNGFSSNAAELTKSVEEIGFRSTRDGKTKLYDAIALGLSELRNHEVKGPKRLILITDGMDDGSSITDQVVIKEANAKGVTIDAIGFGKVSPSGTDLLARLAKNTGGHFVLAKDSAQLSRELQKLLNLPPPRAFEVLFSYKVSDDTPRTNSAWLEFTPSGQSPIAYPIERELSAPQVVPQVVADDKGSVDPKMWLGIFAAVLALLAAYMLSKKKTPPNSRAPEPLTISKPSVTDVPEPVRAKRAKTSVSFAFPAPGKGRPAAYLVCISGAAKGAEFAIEQAVTRIGSGKENELKVSDDYASGKHAVIRYNSGGLYLGDSGSRNGTFLNETQLHGTAMALSPGDHIRVGKTTFELAGGKNQPGHAEEQVNGSETRVP